MFSYDIDPEDDMPLSVDMMVDASAALLQMNRGEFKPERRDEVYFRRVYPTHKLIAERISLDATKTIRNTMRRLNRSRNLSPIGPNQFGDITEKMITGHTLSIPLEEVNPMQIVEQNRRVTQMGPGGIPSSDSVTPEAQAVQASSFGFLSPIEGPENELAGVDMRLALGTKIGEDGRIYQEFIDNRKGEKRYLHPGQLRGKIVTVQ